MLCSKLTGMFIAAALLLGYIGAGSAAMGGTDGNWVVDTSGSWSYAPYWAASMIADGQDANARFSVNITADRTVTLDSNRTIGNLFFGSAGSSGNWILSGSNTLTLDDAGTVSTIDVASRTATISLVLGGSDAVTKTGIGTLVLSGLNKFTGQLTVKEGTLKTATVNNASSAGPLGTSSLSVALGGVGATGTLEYTGVSASSNKTFTLATGGTGAFQIDSNTAILTLTGVINGSGAMIKTGSGTLALSAGNAFTGQLTVKEGTLKTATVNNAGLLGPLGSSSLSVVLGGAGTKGTLEYTDGNASSNKKFTLATGGTGVFQIDTSGAVLTLSGIIDGNGALTKTGNGTLRLDGNNVFTGQLSISAGTLTTGWINDANTFGPLGKSLSSVVLGSYQTQGTLEYTGPTATSTKKFTIFDGSIGEFRIVSPTSALTLSGVIDGNCGLLKTGSGTLALAGSNTFAGDTFVSEGKLRLANTNALAFSTLQTSGIVVFDSLSAVNLGGLTGGLSMALQNEANSPVMLTVGGNNQSTTYSGILSGTGGLIKAGTGTLTLTRANTYSGDTRVMAGKLALASGTDSNALLNSTLDLNADDSGIVGFGSMAYVTLGGLEGSRNLALANDACQPVVLSVGNNNQDTTYSGVLSGPGGLTKTGTGTLTLSGSSMLAGPLTVKAGTLATPIVNNANTPGPLGNSSNSVVLGGYGNVATLEYTGGSATSNKGFSLNGGYSCPSTFQIDDASSTLTLTGHISNSGYMAKTGGGGLTFSDTTLYSCDVTVQGGTLTLASQARAGWGSVLKLAGGVFCMDNSAGVGERLSETTTVYMKGGELKLVGNSQSGVNESFGSLALYSGYSKVTVAGAGQTTSLYAHNHARSPGATVLFRGLPNTVYFDNPPPMVGDDANYGQACKPIVPYAIGDAAATGSGTGFVTYEPDSGIRLLQASEYAPVNTIAQNANIVVNGSYVEGVGVVNSILLTGANASATLSINGRLAVTSGAILSTGLTANSIAGGQLVFSSSTAQPGDGIIFASQDISISSVIAGVSLVKSGDHKLTLSGNNTFTGQLIIQSGSVSTASVNDPHQYGPLGFSSYSVLLGASSPGVIGANGSAATLEYTGGTDTSSKRFTLADGAIGVFQIDSPAATLTLMGAIDGVGGGFVKTGRGTLVLAGNNTFTGPLTVGDGNMILSGNNALTGPVNVNAGTLTLGGGGATNAAGRLTVAQGALLCLDNSATNGIDRIANTATVSLQGGEFKIIPRGAYDSNELYGSLSLVAGDSIVTASGSGSRFAALIATDGMTRSAGATVLFRGLPNGIGLPGIPNGIYFMSGLGSQLVGDANNIGDPSIAIRGKAILPYAIGDGNAAGTGAGFVTCDPNGAIRMLRSNEYTASNTFVSMSNWKVGPGSGLTDGNVAVSTVNSLLLTSGTASVFSNKTLSIASGSILTTGTMTNTISGGYLLFGSNPVTGNEGRVFALADLTISSIIRDGGDANKPTDPNYRVSLVKSGDHSLILIGENTYSGGTTLNSGAIRARGFHSVGYGPVTVNSGGTLWCEPTSDTKVIGSGAAITVNAGGTLYSVGWPYGPQHGGLETGVATVNPGGLLDANGNNALYGASIRLAGGTLSLQHGPSSPPAYCTRIGGSLIVDANSLVYMGRAGVANPGTCQIGTLSVNNATLTIVSYDGSTMEANSAQSLNHALTGQAVLDIDANVSLRMLGRITGTGQLVKNGRGALYLTENGTGSSDYAGGTAVNAGTVYVTRPYALGTGSVVVNAGACLEANANGTLNDASIHLVGGTLVLRNDTGFWRSFGGSITVEANSTINVVPYAADAGISSLAVNNATLAVTAISSTKGSGFLGVGASSIAGQAVLDVASNAYLFLEGITGPGELVKKGGGILEMGYAESYAGPTTVLEGALFAVGPLPHNGSDMVFIAPDANLSVSITRHVSSGDSYVGYGSAVAGHLHTTADILAGDNASGTVVDVTMAWRTPSDDETFPNETHPPVQGSARGLASDVLDLSGMHVATDIGQTDPFVLQMSYDPATIAIMTGTDEQTLALAEQLYLAWLDPSDGWWKSAVLGNYGGTNTFAGIGAWTDYGASGLGDDLGRWGVNVGNHTVWAVINHNSQFAVTPEPFSAAALAVGGLFLLRRRVRRT